MKKLLIILCMAFAYNMQISAQSLYKTVYERAISVVNDPKSSEEDIQINQFKVTVLNYITSQVKRRAMEKDSYFYDSQAVNLASFITDFESDLLKARGISTAKRLEVINCYRDASLANPLFNDSDKEKVYCYVNDKQTFTPFSIDTDWEKAYDIVTAKIKTILK